MGNRPNNTSVHSTGNSGSGSGSKRSAAVSPKKKELLICWRRSSAKLLKIVGLQQQHLDNQCRLMKSATSLPPFLLHLSVTGISNFTIAHSSVIFCCFYGRYLSLLPPPLMRSVSRTCVEWWGGSCSGEITNCPLPTCKHMNSDGIIEMNAMRCC